jgi:RimJ/RimL family protein N-acetyltransferase
MNRENLLSAPEALSTARLRLERPKPEHAAIVMESVNASLRDLRFVDWGLAPLDAERAMRLYERDAAMVAKGSCLIYHAFELHSGVFVGSLDLHSFDFEVPRCEIGYVGDSRRSGSGLMSEAAAAVLVLAFELGIERVAAYCDVRNERSIRFAERLGMRREGVLRSHARDLEGECCDQVVLALLRGDRVQVERTPR